MTTSGKLTVFSIIIIHRFFFNLLFFFLFSLNPLEPCIVTTSNHTSLDLNIGTVIFLQKWKHKIMFFNKYILKWLFISSNWSSGDNVVVHDDVAVVQLPSPVWLFVTRWTAEHQASLSLSISRSLPKFMSTELVIPSNHLTLCRSRLLLPSIIPSVRVSSNKSAVCIKWPKYWSFSINPSKEYSGLISFKIDWLDLLIFQGTLKSLPSNTVRKHQFFSALPSFLSSSYICTWLLERP